MHRAVLPRSEHDGGGRTALLQAIREVEQSGTAHAVDLHHDHVVAVQHDDVGLDVGNRLCLLRLLRLAPCLFELGAHVVELARPPVQHGPRLAGGHRLDPAGA